MRRDDVAEFFATNYVPANIVVAGAGAVDHDDLVAAAGSLSDARGGGANPTRSAPVRQQSSVVVDEQDTEQVHVCIGMPTVALGHDDRYPLAVIDQLLGGGLSSRLFQEVREKRGLAYSIYTYRSLFSDAGVFVVAAGTAPSKVGDTLDVIGAELARLLQGVNARELDIAKRHLVGAFHLSLEDTGARMASIASSQLNLGHVDDVDVAAARIRSVEATDVERVARELIAAPRTVAVVGPVSEADIAERVGRW
jgi:predicted Zn-dependent peptidase